MMPRYIATVEFADPETDLPSMWGNSQIRSLCLAPEGSKLRQALSTPERWFKVNLQKVEENDDSDTSPVVDMARVDGLVGANI